MGAPGVIVEEGGAAVAAAKRAVAVPVFVGVFMKDDGSRWPLTTGCIPIPDEQALRNLFPNMFPATVKVTANVATVTFHSLQLSTQAIAHYFANGGGPCYLLPIASGSDTGYATHVLKHPEISLLASAIDNTSYQATVVSEMQSVLTADPHSFYIANSGAATGGGYEPSKLKDQTASYHPFLQIATNAWRDDNHISVSGVADVTTLAELKKANRLLYAQADAQIRAKYAENQSIIMPPAPAIAAAYCKTDRERGTWKSPANIVIDKAEPYINVTAAEQAPLNDKGINVIRRIDGQTLIWGARTCDTSANGQRYIATRRLLSQVELDLTNTLNGFAGSPNSPSTWIRARAALNSYLYSLWQLGGLAGNSPEEGYQVNIGESTMNNDEIAAGQLIAQVFLAPAKPAEFIVLQVTQQLAGLEA